MPAKRKRPEQVSQPAAPISSTRRVTRQTPVLPPLPPTSAAQAPGVTGPAAGASASDPTPPASRPTATTTATATTTTTTTTTAGATSAQTPVPIPTPPGRPAARHRGRPLAAPASRPPLIPSTPTVQTPVPVPFRHPVSPRSIVPPLSAAVGISHSLGGQNVSGVANRENARPSDLVAPEITYHVPQSPLPGRVQSSLLRPHGPSALPPRLDRRPAPPVVTPVLPPKPPTLAVNDRGPPRADRNIDKVVLGDLCFRTWYPSYYGKEVLGDISGNVRNGNCNKEGNQDTGSKHPKRDKDARPMLERLYVCPSCFKYAKELVAWRGHVRICERNRSIPGKKIYIHPRGRRKVLIAYDSGKGSGPKRRRGDGGVRHTEEIVQDEGEWSIWEVDGEKNGLFCQNLSLFAKLFLDNKSVFFDVSGFNYFLLVYTPSAKPSDPGTEPAPNHVPQVTGFFSKEKMSWDNNNLACILVFPPWQRKGLGALLMGASYEISRREGVLGGPEKPISDLGKKGYKRFWSGEISRWLLGLDGAARQERTQAQAQLQLQQGQTHVPMRMPMQMQISALPTQQDAAAPTQELIIDINDCSQGTWIATEDCLSVLRDMGVVEDAGMGCGKPAKTDGMKESEAAENDQGSALANRASEERQDATLELPEDNNHDSSDSSSDSSSTSNTNNKAADAEPPKLVRRVRVDKEAIRRYVATHRISLERSCDPNGFTEGYAMKTAREGNTEGAKHVAEPA